MNDLEIPLDLRAAAMHLGSDELIVVSFPIAHDEDEKRLTAAERAVVDLAAKGLTNAAIAAIRRTSARTVANQLASAFRKLHIHARCELAARR